MAAARTTTIAVALTLALGAEALTYAWLIRHTGLPHARLLVVIAAPIWLLAVWLLSRLRLSLRAAAMVVLGASAVLQLIALSHVPTTSDDDYRYAWDAKVQLAGIDPYRYAPSAPELAHLREPWLFGAPEHCQHPFPGGCTSINRPTVHTIYPPVAQGAFVVIRISSFGGHGEHLPLQLAALLGTLVVGWLLLRYAAARGRPWLAAVWAWCPVTITEYANNAHIDWLAVLLVVVALCTGLVRRTGWAAGLVTAAVLVKVYPALVLPSLMRRRPYLVAGIAVGLTVLAYVPHLIAAGSDVIGYLPGYLKEENYASGKRLLLLGEVLPHPADTVVGALLVAATAVWAWRCGDPDDPARSAVVVVGVALLVFTPTYPWYTGLLLALVAMTGAIEWVPLAFAATAVYLYRPHDATRSYAVAGLLVLAVLVVRKARTSRAGRTAARG